MNLVFIDFETWWSQDHTLTNMSPIAYCMHPETEIISCAIKYNNAPTDVFFGEAEIRRVFAKLDWSNNFVIAHNMSGFDSMLLAWRFGVRPKMWGCTLAMARPIHAKTTGLSLAKLVAHYELGVKDNRALIQTRGKHLKDFTPDELAAMEVYNKADTDQCAALFHKLKAHYTPAELWHLDCNIRMLVEPQFELDTGLLQTALSVERSNKHKALLDLAKLLKPQWEPMAVDVTDGPEYTDPFWDQPEADIAEWVKTQMNSAPKFCAILEARGVEVPLKYSPTDPEKQIPAIAKTDEAMEELLEHDDEVVATAARARLSAKSTQLETRIQLFLDTYKIVGKLPVPAHYCGADTTGRDSGFLYNMYNLPRIQKKPRVSDALRKSVLAPPGKVIMVRDSSGIELRVNHTLWKVGRSTQLWKKNPVADLYIGTAASYYGVPESEITKEDPRRQLGKVLELSCGYGIGHVKLRNQARAQYGLRLSPEEAKMGVDNWRARYPEITANDTGGWALCEEALHYVAAGDRRSIDPWGLLTTEKDAIVGPSGRRIRYPNLRQEWVDQWQTIDGVRVKKKKRAWVYDDMRKLVYLYGGKVDENIVQFLARDIVFGQILEFFKKTGMRPKHKVYDEAVYLVDPAEAADRNEQLGEIMRTPPSWWPELVVWSEGGIAASYGAAK